MIMIIQRTLLNKLNLTMFHGKIFNINNSVDPLQSLDSKPSAEGIDRAAIGVEIHTIPLNLVYKYSYCYAAGTDCLQFDSIILSSVVPALSDSDAVIALLHNTVCTYTHACTQQAKLWKRTSALVSFPVFVFWKGSCLPIPVIDANDLQIISQNIIWMSFGAMHNATACGK